MKRQCNGAFWIMKPDDGTRPLREGYSVDDETTYFLRPKGGEKIKFHYTKTEAIAGVNPIIQSPREIGGEVSVCLLLALLFGAVVSLVLIKR